MPSTAGPHGQLAERARWAALAAALLATVSLGCPGAPADDDDTRDDDTDETPADDDDSAGDDGLIGQLRVLHWRADSQYGEPAALVRLWGLYDAPFPGAELGIVATEAWTVVAEQGDCVYIDAVGPDHCDPPCAGTELCTAEGGCVPFPSLQPAGAIELDGLLAPVTLTPDELGFYHLEGELPYPLFVPGADVALSATDGATPGFAIRVTAPDELADPVPCELPLAAGQPLELQWSPAPGDPGDPARVRWELISFMHAGNGPLLRCETDDDGALTVGAALVDRYLADRTGFETFEQTRFRRARATLPDGAQVALEVASVRTCFHLPDAAPSVHPGEAR